MMDVKNIEKEIETLSDEYMKLVHKGTMTTSDLDAKHKLAATLHYLCKLKHDFMNDYSMADYNINGSYGNGYRGNGMSMMNSYANGDSYANQGEHYVRGHYSRNDGADMMRESIRRKMEDPNTNSTDRRTLERALEII